MKRMSPLLLLSLLVLFVSCGKKSLVEDLKVRAYEEDGSKFANVLIALNMGNAHLPSVSIPIYGPDDINTKWGEVALRGGLGSVNEIELSLNLTELTSLPGGVARMPDGGPLPVAGLPAESIIQIPLDNDRHRLYLATDQGVAMIGVALTFPIFNQMGRAIQGTDVLIPFEIKGIRFIAGIFTSKSAGKSGFAIFVDAGPVIYPPAVLLEQSIKRKNLVFRRPRVPSYHQWPYEHYMSSYHYGRRQVRPSGQ